MIKPKLEKEIEHLLTIQHEFKLSLIISADFAWPKKDIEKIVKGNKHITSRIIKERVQDGFEIREKEVEISTLI